MQQSILTLSTLSSLLWLFTLNREFCFFSRSNIDLPDSLLCLCLWLFYERPPVHSISVVIVSSLFFFLQFFSSLGFFIYLIFRFILKWRVVLVLMWLKSKLSFLSTKFCTIPTQLFHSKILFLPFIFCIVLFCFDFTSIFIFSHINLSVVISEILTFKCILEFSSSLLLLLPSRFSLSSALSSRLFLLDFCFIFNTKESSTHSKPVHLLFRSFIVLVVE